MRWKKLNQQGDVPIGRSSHTMSPIHSTHLMLWGGEQVPRSPLPGHVSLFNLATNTWTTIPSNDATTPLARVGHTAETIANSSSGEQVYIYGGRTEALEDSTLGDLHAFDPVRGAWRAIHPTTDFHNNNKTPLPRNYHASCSIPHDKCFYIFGGCSGTDPDTGGTRRLNDAWRFDTTTERWEALPVSDAIAGRGGPGFVATEDGGSLYVIGGFTGKEASDIHRFDVRMNTWETHISSPDHRASTPKDSGRAGFTARSVFGCGSVGRGSGEVVVFGGEMDPSELGHAGAGIFSNATFCFDPVEKKWRDCEVSTMAVVEGGEREEETAEEEVIEGRGWVASTTIQYTSPNPTLVVSGGVTNENKRLQDLLILIE